LWFVPFLIPNPGDIFTLRTTGSSNGRGPRVAGWLQDTINEKGDDSIKSVAMTGGIKGWAKAGEEYTSQMVGYEKEAWETKPDGCA
jgi:arsenical-resistance protein 2